MTSLLFKVGFLDITFTSVIDVFLVALLLFYLYRLLKGSLAFNIFIGFLLFYMAWQLLRALEIELTASILEAFVGVGSIALLIVFQPEVRRFLLMLGKDNVLSRNKYVRKYFIQNAPGIGDDELIPTVELEKALVSFSKTKTGAILVFPKTSRLSHIAETGTLMEARISYDLLESIFEKNSPLHDGALIIFGNRIHSAKCILPVSSNQNIPGHLGTRHRAAIGITESSDAIALLVSEESGKISASRNGKLEMDLMGLRLQEVIKEALTD